jgi:formate dehydrogenase major subunit
VITTDNSDWATNCPEYKVTAVQVMPVMQPSAWQQEYSRFNRIQHELLGAAEASHAASAD